MAHIKLTDSPMPDLKTPTFDPAKLTAWYDSTLDALYVNFESASRPATSIDIKGEAWLRVDPVSGQVFGIEIEDFEAVFIKKHPELGAAWRRMKGRIRRNRSGAEPLALWKRIQMLLDADQLKRLRLSLSTS